MPTLEVFQLAAIMAKHDPVMLTKIAAVLDIEDVDRRKRTAADRLERKGRKTP